MGARSLSSARSYRRVMVVLARLPTHGIAIVPQARLPSPRTLGAVSTRAMMVSAWYVCFRRPGSTCGPVCRPVDPHLSHGCPPAPLDRLAAVLLWLSEDGSSCHIEEDHELQRRSAAGSDAA